MTASTHLVCCVLLWHRYICSIMWLLRYVLWRMLVFQKALHQLPELRSRGS
jgi:hypothetical protein